MFKRESLSGLNIPCSSRAEDFFVVRISFVRSYLPMEDPGALREHRHHLDLPSSRRLSSAGTLSPLASLCRGDKRAFWKSNLSLSEWNWSRPPFEQTYFYIIVLSKQTGKSLLCCARPAVMQNGAERGERPVSVRRCAAANLILRLRTIRTSRWRPDVRVSSRLLSFVEWRGLGPGAERRRSLKAQPGFRGESVQVQGSTLSERRRDKGRCCWERR